MRGRDDRLRRLPRRMSQEFKSLPDSSTIITADAPSGRPIFIVGLSRSGSTLLSKMLDAHSALAIFPETWCYVQLDLLDCFEILGNTSFS